LEEVVVLLLFLHRPEDCPQVGLLAEAKQGFKQQTYLVLQVSVEEVAV
jgi:hypothetical protein